MGRRRRKKRPAGGGGKGDHAGTRGRGDAETSQLSVSPRLPPSAFRPPPSSFILHPSAFRLPPSSFIIIALLLLAVAAIYGQTLGFDFVNYDDREYVINNRMVNRGLTAEGVVWAFTRSCQANWHPLTWLSHMLDCQLYGLHPWGHHLSNVLLHAAATVLLFLALRRMTARSWPSGLVAAVFAVHPLHVESAAWIAERKDVLSGLCFMLTLWLYARYVDRAEGGRRKAEGSGATAGLSSSADSTGGQATRGTRQAEDGRWKSGGRGAILALYLSVVAALALGLMAKPMLVTLPFVLLLLDYWPLGRFAKAEEDAGSCHVPASPRPRVPASSSFPQRPVPSNVRLVVEKIPLFVLAAASCAVTLWAQRAGEAVIDVPSAPLGLRLANALVSYTAYIGQSFWPAGLAAFYPHPGHYADPWKYLPAWKVAGAAALLAAVSALALIGRRKYPYLLVGWLWFLGMLVPVIGLVQVGKQAMADRYMYLPQIGLAIALAWAFFGGRKAEGGRMKDEGGGRRAEGGGRKAEGGGRKAEGGRMKAEGGGMRDEGGGRKAEGGRRKAEGGGRKAEGGGRKAEGGGRKAEGGPGEERAGSGEGAKAQSVASSVILPPSTFRPPPSAFRLPPSAFVAVAALTVLAAAAWKQTTYWRNAEALWRRDYDITRGDDACNGLGNALYIEGRSDDAAEWFRKAIALSPRWVEPACRLGALLVAQGRLDEAIEHFERAARSAPDEFGARERLEETRALRRRLDEDIARLRKALEREPDRVNLHHLLAKALLARGRPAEALQQWCEILRLEPRNMALMNNMAWLLATDPEVSIRNAAEAVRLAQGAAELAQDRDPTVLDTLAAAQAEAGRFEEALATAGKALDLAIAQGKTALANSLRARIELYRAGKPFRDQRQGGKG